MQKYALQQSTSRVTELGVIPRGWVGLPILESAVPRGSVSVGMCPSKSRPRNRVLAASRVSHGLVTSPEALLRAYI